MLEGISLLELAGLVDFWKGRAVTKRTLKSEKI